VFHSYSKADRLPDHIKEAAMTSHSDTQTTAPGLADDPITGPVILPDPKKTTGEDAPSEADAEREESGNGQDT
jgi:hypothetical protein